jgi:RNA polymerase sigma-70 factor (ECF subfamily)
MSESHDVDRLLVERIRSGDQAGWKDLIERYEGRLFAFVESRLQNRSQSEDIVQEAFIGFLTSLPNYDGKRPLEGYLFSICAYKLTDHLRREGRRPSVPLSSGGPSSGDWDVPDKRRPASSIVRSVERRRIEEDAVVQALREQIDYWRARGDWSKIKCVELLIVRGWPNKKTAEQLDLSEQQVANFKFEFLAKMKTALKKQRLPEDVFPELYDES